METLFKDVSFAGVLRPGEVYLLTEHENRGLKMEPLEFLYSIRSDDEIARALDMTMFKLLKDYYDFKEFLGYDKVSKDCLRFRVKAIDKFERKNIVYPFYLQRLTTFQETLADVMKYL